MKMQVMLEACYLVKYIDIGEQKKKKTKFLYPP